jgi:hypothetical protein
MIRLHQYLIELYEEYAQKYQLRHTIYRCHFYSSGDPTRYERLYFAPVAQCAADVDLDQEIIKIVTACEIEFCWMEEDD